MTGASGEPPVGDHEQRQRLVVSLARANAEYAAAASAYGTLSGEHKDALEYLATIASQVEAHVLDRLMSERADEVTRFLDVCEREVKPRLAAIMGLHRALVNRAQMLDAAGQQDQARGLYQRAEILARSAPKVDLMPTNAEVATAATRWTARLGDMTKDHAE